LSNDSKTNLKLLRKNAPPEAEGALRFVELFKKAVKGRNPPTYVDEKLAREDSP
jgi:hypothetical protein